jgi:chemotaxis protein MotB
MQFKYFFFLLIGALVLSSCTSSKKLKESEARYKKLSDQYVLLEASKKDCTTAKDELERQKQSLEKDNDFLKKQIEFLKSNNESALSQLKDLSVISASQAESINKSLENIGAKDNYIRTIQQAAARKDSLNMRLVMNLKGAIGNMSDEDVQIKVDKSAVMITLSDKMLFKSGSYKISDKASEVLGKVAQILNAHNDLDILIEGNTDNVPIKNSCIADNWDLSVLRATAITRVLQTKYNIDPKRITAGGRGQYMPLTTNDTEEGKSINRRTRIIVMPQLDQFFKLLEPK